MLLYGVLTLLGLAMTCWRLARGIVRASRSVARAGGAGRTRGSFEERMAERMRELERTDPPIASAPDNPQTVAGPPPVAHTAAGVRTFGRRS